MVDDDEENKARLDDFEHLSHFDPEDEFLQSSRSFSIIDSVMSKDFGKNDGLAGRISSKSATSEFSILQQSVVS